MDRRSILPQTIELLSLGLALLVVLVIGGLAYQTWGAYTVSTQALQVSESVRVDAEALLSTLKDAETSQRGYLLTDRERYLNPYRQALAQLPQIVKRLNGLVRERPDQRRRVILLEPLVQMKLEELRETIDVRRSQGPDAALNLVLSDRGRVLMDQIREIVDEMKQASLQRSRRYSEDVRVAAQRLGLVSTLGSLGLFVLLALSTAAITRATNRRQQLIGQLAESEERTRVARDWLQTTLSSIGDGVVATDAEGKVVFLNPVAQELTGWTQEAAQGVPLEDVFIITNEDTGATVENPALRALREGRVVGLANHTKLTARDGVERPIDDSAAPIRDLNGKVSGVVLVFRDVTERKAAEDAVVQSVQQFRTMADHAPVLVWIAGTDKRATWFNQPWLQFVGRTLEEELRRDPVEAEHPEDHARIQAVYHRAFDARETFTVEYRLQRHDGEYRWMLSNGAPLFDRTGKFEGYIGSCIDITERKQVEEKLLRANEDLNQFAYAASHDLQEPLRMITTYAQLLVSGYRGQLDEEAAMCVKSITEGTRRMRELLGDLLVYTQVDEDGQPSQGPVDLNTVYDAVRENLRTAIADSGAELVLAEKLPKVFGHRAHFAQLLQNLLSNAIKYRGDRPLRIELTVRRHGPEWQFCVADNGIGIDPEYHEKIFGVFKRLHGREIPGTGIGLAICQRVVERYGGRIWVNSRAGEGASFYFTLPMMEGGY